MSEGLATFTKCKLECFVVLSEGAWKGARVEGWVAIPPGHRYYGDLPVSIPITPGFTMCADLLRVGARVMTHAWFVGRAWPKDAPLPIVKSELRRMVEDMTTHARAKKVRP